jgi:hypothetical protein
MPISIHTTNYKIKMLCLLYLFSVIFFAIRYGLTTPRGWSSHVNFHLSLTIQSLQYSKIY